ncbi:MAG: sucrose-6-phosphate hydrolase [Solobacterium sp.]|nr:sucrose-6-phosphate hydrolase [Solobacterium sp.]
MKSWTRKERYISLSKERLVDLKKLHDSIKNNRWRTFFHLQPVTGLMGDTNGFSFFNGKWHLFYQWFPYGGVHGLKHWYHVESKDLLNWHNVGLGIAPSNDKDNQGVFSGSGYVEQDTLYLPYTGNKRDENWIRYPYQMMAKMDKDGKITKLEKELIGPINGYSEHQRDPKLFKEGDYYYILIGVQDLEGKGKFLFLRSKQIETDWEVYGELKIQGYDDFGFMVECPDIEKIDDKWILLFSPQGLKAKGEYFNNVYNNTYFIGDLDLETLTFIPDSELKELDRGFDFYAAQCTSDPNDQNHIYLSAWCGLPDSVYEPIEELGYSGLQVFTRELTIKDGKLIQMPIDNYEALKGNCYINSDTSINGALKGPSILEIKELEGDFEVDLCNFKVNYDANNKKLVMDRGQMTNQLNIDFGLTRTITLENDLKDLLILLDTSIIEIFINKGEYVATARIFPNEDENGYSILMNKGNIQMYDALRSVTDDFVIYPSEDK